VFNLHINFCVTKKDSIKKDFDHRNKKDFNHRNNKKRFRSPQKRKISITAKKKDCDHCSKTKNFSFLTCKNHYLNKFFKTAGAWSCTNLR